MLLILIFITMIIIVVVIIIIVVSLYYSTITKQFIHVHFTMSFSTPNGYSLNLMFLHFSVLHNKTLCM